MSPTQNPNANKPFAIDYDDVARAAQRLDGHALVTPLIRSDIIDNMCGKSVWMKAECLQKVGAFKYRGAYNRLSQLTEPEKAAGVVAYSSGNHAQGVSRAAKELGISAIIVMPDDAPKIKVAGVERDGADIVFYDRATQSREAIADDIAKRDGRVIVPSYDDANIMAGQGTAGLEAMRQANRMKINFDAIIVPMGGGGLCAGISTALSKASPKTLIFGAEPQFYNDHQKSLKSGHRERLVGPPPTICDALMTPQPGALTFPINKAYVRGVMTASDLACQLAMATIDAANGITVEPGGAVGLAAVLGGAFDDYPDIKTICVVLSGGNVDAARMDEARRLLAPD